MLDSGHGLALLRPWVHLHQCLDRQIVPLLNGWTVLSGELTQYFFMRRLALEKYASEVLYLFWKI